jgi:hypothetical protein
LLKNDADQRVSDDWKRVLASCLNTEGGKNDGRLIANVREINNEKPGDQI